MESNAFVLIDYKTGIAPEFEADEARLRYSRQLYYYSWPLKEFGENQCLKISLFL